MDENNAVGQTYESIMSDRLKMYEFRIKLAYVDYDDLSAKIQFTTKQVRTLKDKIKKCQQIGSKLGIAGKVVHILSTRPLRVELFHARLDLDQHIRRRKDKKKQIMRTIFERNSTYDKLNSLEK